jgi:hypothetical protein
MPEIKKFPKMSNFEEIKSFKINENQGDFNFLYISEYLENDSTIL